MALTIFLLPLGSSFIRNLPKQIITKAIGNTERRWRIHCVANEQAKNLSTNQHSGYYKPSSWTHEFVMSLMNDSGVIHSFFFARFNKLNLVFNIFFMCRLYLFFMWRILSAVYNLIIIGLIIFILTFHDIYKHCYLFTT